MTESTANPIALVTGASSGIGAMYADRLAKRGYDLVLVARSLDRLEKMADNLYRTHGVATHVCHADLSVGSDLLRVTKRLWRDPAISLVVNCAGIGPEGSVLTSEAARNDEMIQLNVTALHAITIEAAKVFSSRNAGSIINIASVTAIMAERFNATYSATKAFVLALGTGLAHELAPHGVHIQTVLPGLTRTEIFERAGIDIGKLDPEMVMDAGAMVDAALTGFDNKEVVTVPSLEDAGLWEAFDQSRFALHPYMSFKEPAHRYTKRRAEHA
jgi:short-subunit dehydrogenase